MMPVELENLIGYVQNLKAETQTLEVKAATGRNFASRHS